MSGLGTHHLIESIEFVKDIEIAKIFYDVKCLVISCRLPIFVENARRGCIYT